MSEFDIAFELFALLLGLSLAEVLAGYARAYKLRRRIRLGRLAPGDRDARARTAPQQVRIGWLALLSAAVAPQATRRGHSIAKIANFVRMRPIS